MVRGINVGNKERKIGLELGMEKELKMYQCMMHTMWEDKVERVGLFERGGYENREWNIENRDDRGIIINWSRESNRIGIGDFSSGSKLESRHYGT